MTVKHNIPIGLFEDYKLLIVDTHFMPLDTNLEMLSKRVTIINQISFTTVVVSIDRSKTVKSEFLCDYGLGSTSVVFVIKISQYYANTSQIYIMRLRFLLYYALWVMFKDIRYGIGNVISGKH